MRLRPIAPNLAVAVLLLAPGANAQTGRDSTSLETKMRALEQRVEQLEQQKATRNEKASAASATAPTAGPRGFFIRSDDGGFQLRLRGLLQSDTRLVRGAPVQSATTFLVRRARPIFEATAYEILDARFVPDFGQGKVEIFDANVDLRIRPWFVVRAGKFKPPIGLERLQAVADVVFVERGMPANLVPQRDLGVQFGGDMRSGALAWAVGAFNGALDGATSDLDNGSQKDVAARLFALPFKSGHGALKNFGIGVGFSTGMQYGTAASPVLPSYKSPAQQTIFAYRSDLTAAGTTVSDGLRQRIAPQAYWYTGPVGLMAEYTVGRQDVRRDVATTSLTNTAWQAMGTIVLTGEAASFRSITPAHPFGADGSGAFEVGARVGRMELDDAAFPVFADPNAAIHDVSSAGLVFTWYLAPGIKLVTELDQSRFTGGKLNGNREDERAALIRLQHAF